jgi:hypothetical protein
VRAAVVLGGHLDVRVVFAAVPVAIFDAQIREMHFVIEVREVVFVGPFPDLVVGPIRVSVIVIAVAIPLMEPALVIPLELVIEDDALDPRIALDETLRGAFVGAIDLEVVFEFPLAFDARPERLTVALVAVTMVFEQASAFSREGDRMLTRTGQPNRLHQSLLAQMSQVA